MKVVAGIDLGSTTSKAVLLDEAGRVVGKGITNTRSNYDVAVDVARTEAMNAARFGQIERRVRALADSRAGVFLGALATEQRIAAYLHQLERLRDALARSAGEIPAEAERTAVAAVVTRTLDSMRSEARKHFRLGQADGGFFRDLAQSDYMQLAQEAARASGVAFERLATLFDKSIIVVENVIAELAFETSVGTAYKAVLDRFGAELGAKRAALERALEEVLADPIETAGSVGTGYGRARLPFPKEQIRSEILCHGLGAHRMFPGTRTVLDIGGQDTKAIQLDAQGIVTSFQMNDRCAAGCGRYLGYIADEMSLGVHELGPMAEKSGAPTRINSTCTVFAGAELRDRLTAGEKREDILAGLHRAIILRAMSLLARSGGVNDEFTFTGGVAKNVAAVRALKELVSENYGERTINISPDSIFTGALGAATFAHRDVFNQEVAA